jgi:hypothetical protein
MPQVVYLYPSVLQELVRRFDKFEGPDFNALRRCVDDVCTVNRSPVPFDVRARCNWGYLRGILLDIITSNRSSAVSKDCMDLIKMGDAQIQKENHGSHR